MPFTLSVDCGKFYTISLFDWLYWSMFCNSNFLRNTLKEVYQCHLTCLVAKPTSLKQL